MNGFDFFYWTWAAYIVVRLIKSGDRKYWLQLGMVLGLGSLNKIGMLWFAGGIFLGLLLSTNRRWFKTKWPWIAGGFTFLLFLPFIAWNAMHDFAHLEFIRNATGGDTTWGKDGVSISIENGLLIVVHNPEVQKEVQQLILSLRQYK